VPRRTNSQSRDIYVNKRFSIGIALVSCLFSACEPYHYGRGGKGYTLGALEAIRFQTTSLVGTGVALREIPLLAQTTYPGQHVVYKLSNNREGSLIENSVVRVDSRLRILSFTCSGAVRECESTTTCRVPAECTPVETLSFDVEGIEVGAARIEVVGPEGVLVDYFELEVTPSANADAGGNP